MIKKDDYNCNCGDPKKKHKEVFVLSMKQDEGGWSKKAIERVYIPSGGIYSAITHIRDSCTYSSTGTVCGYSGVEADEYWLGGTTWFFHFGKVTVTILPTPDDVKNRTVTITFKAQPGSTFSALDTQEALNTITSHLALVKKRTLKYYIEFDKEFYEKHKYKVPKDAKCELGPDRASMTCTVILKVNDQYNP